MPPTCYRIDMSWLLPVPLLLIAGVASLFLVPSLVRRSASTPRLVAEAFGATLGVISLVWFGWVVSTVGHGPASSPMVGNLRLDLARRLSPLFDLRPGGPGDHLGQGLLNPCALPIG